MQTGCSSSAFVCNNGNCVPGYQLCDDSNDCGDGSDEFGCGECVGGREGVSE